MSNYNNPNNSFPDRTFHSFFPLHNDPVLSETTQATNLNANFTLDTRLDFGVLENESLSPSPFHPIPKIPEEIYSVNGQQLYQNEVSKTQIRTEEANNLTPFLMQSPSISNINVSNVSNPGISLPPSPTSPNIPNVTNFSAMYSSHTADIMGNDDSSIQPNSHMNSYNMDIASLQKNGLLTPPTFIAGHPYYQIDPNYICQVLAEEDKRRRNTAASARFRVKKKLREQELEKQSREMTEKAMALENKVRELEREIKWLKSLVVEKDERLLSIERPDQQQNGT
ncbi:7489_t:CDS:1 [Diversispora eburnea]|uniref:7489_t:CDS:1 n=1 Tax=Diversispora eburnea TaxID=1213867 RepID=A0A9N8V526_9GLOM|nr:7489_t:CDS:1 [Diversispora eburnea]